MRTPTPQPPLTDRVLQNAPTAFELLVRYRNFISVLELPAGPMQLEADELFSASDELLEATFRMPLEPTPHSIINESRPLKRRYE